MFWLIITSIISLIVGMAIRSWMYSFTYKGSIVVQKHPSGKLIYTLVIGGDLEQLQYRKNILLRVTPVDSVDPELNLEEV